MGHPGRWGELEESRSPARMTERKARAKETAGLSTALRFGRDDRVVVRRKSNCKNGRKQVPRVARNGSEEGKGKCNGWLVWRFAFPP